ncbi:cation transporter [Flavobacterium sp. I3-2]|uniref:cation transporter n=1 Tax=Flavobacterium sp. I3-2 TaxID=2748319 RepID=UPI0015AB4BD8|nr:heavy-metal-associated domain-containing protein [Flavobacterium sp. I3-2]
MNIKRILNLLIVLFLTFSAQAQNKKNDKAEIKLSIECDHCKVCETCGLNFRDNMLKVKGVTMYELNEETKTMTVYYNTKKTDLSKIKTAISKLGFDADEVKADPEAYEKLDGCCKKA